MSVCIILLYIIRYNLNEIVIKYLKLLKNLSAIQYYWYTTASALWLGMLGVAEFYNALRLLNRKKHKDLSAILGFAVWVLLWQYHLLTNDLK